MVRVIHGRPEEDVKADICSDICGGAVLLDRMYSAKQNTAFRNDVAARLDFQPDPFAVIGCPVFDQLGQPAACLPEIQPFLAFLLAVRDTETATHVHEFEILEIRCNIKQSLCSLQIGRRLHEQ